MGGWGHLVGWNGAGGSTASEYAQGRIDSFNAELRRPARKIHVMSEEAWARKAEKAKKEHEEKEAKLEKERKEKKLAKEQALVPFQERVERDKKFSSLIKDKLLLYHEPAGEEQYDEKKWEPVYTQVSPFLAKVVLVYRYTVARDSGKLAGKDLDYCGGWNLESYLDSRGLALSDDEKGFFKDLLSNKVRPQKLAQCILDLNAHLFFFFFFFFLLSQPA